MAGFEAHLDRMDFARSDFWPRDDEAALRERFWHTLGAAVARIPFAEDLLAAYYCAFDGDTPLMVKGMLVSAIAYFVLPSDAIPDIMPVFGFSDDAAVLAATVKLVAGHIRPLHREMARGKLSELAGR
jgi:uncharacterized membrane protein YkvA (DUF1232 family)